MKEEEASNGGIKNGRNHVLSESNTEEGMLEKGKRRKEERNPILNKRNGGDLLGSKERKQGMEELGMEGTIF